MSTRLRSAAIAAALATVAATGAGASPAVTITSPGMSFESGPYTLGFSFDVSSAQTINQLGVFDEGGAPLAVDAQVGLWNAAGDLLTSVTVPASGGTVVNGFRYANITPFVLSPGQTYFVGAHLSSGTATSIFTQGGGTGSFNPLITPVRDQHSDFGAGFSFPGISFGDAGGAWLGANFNLSAVPESATWAMLILGVAFAGFALRRRERGALAVAGSRGS